MSDTPNKEFRGPRKGPRNDRHEHAGEGRGGRKDFKGGPKRDFDRRGPKRDGEGRGPRREGDSRDFKRDGDSRGPKRDFKGRGPKRDFGDRKPKRDFGDKKFDKRGFDRRGPRPEGEHEGEERPRNNFDRNRERGKYAPVDVLEFFGTCPFGFEDVLAEELRAMGIRRVRPLKGGVSFQGKAKDGYRACMWARSASRILMVIDRVVAKDADELYESIKALPWEEHIDPEKTIAVFARGTSNSLRNTAFTGMKVKDAVCDRLREQCGSRPNVESHSPDVGIWVNLHGSKATVNIDFAGGSLHRRGYREEGVQVEAPLKEALAAGILLRSGWDKVCDEVATFVDPMCGSGTFVIEAAMIAADRAPGLLRSHWGFQGWKGYKAEEFDEVLDEADERLEKGLERDLPLFLGSDVDARCIQIARHSAANVGFADKVRFEVADCAELGTLLEACGADLEKPGFVSVNPPYGMRLYAGEMDSVNEKLRQGLTPLPAGWNMVAITPDATFDAAIAMDATEVTTVYNGRIEASVRQYDLGCSRLEQLNVTDLVGNEITVAVSSGHAEQFAARLRKVAKLRRKWAQREGIHAYRIYDADLPDYAVAIDVIEGMPIKDPVKEQREFDARRNGGKFQQKRYRNDGGKFDARRDDKPVRTHVHAKTISADQVLSHLEAFLVVSEYQAPRDIDVNKAARRFDDAVKVAAATLGIPLDNVCTRVRKQDKGGSKYAEGGYEHKHVLTVEGGHVFELDLKGYLDTGLFLDHRPVRGMIEQMAKGKRFCNLFAYTGSVSVYAAAGGAASCATVDLSATYLEWARRNMQRNDFRDRAYRFSKSDSMNWLDKAAEEAEEFDLIFVDPPTFSNSKSMGERTWDIQRDHVEMLGKCEKVLAEGGMIIFSGNLRSFKLDVEALSELGLVCKDITEPTIPEDFARNKRIHFCYRITRG